MERGLSQQALCKGICAVSYLSKIEKGTATPGEEIIRLLFGALHVDFQLDESFLRDTRLALDAYFMHAAYMEPAGAERQTLLSVREKALQSPLADPYALFLVYEALEEQHNEQAEELLRGLSPQEDREQLFFTALAHGLIACDKADGVAWYQKAVYLRPYSIALYYLGECLHHHGAYQEAISYLQQAYARAAEEGCPFVLLYAANLTAVCYADLYQEDLMMKYFRQARRLAQAIAPSILHQMDYNIGATLVSMRKSAEALPFLQRVLLDSENCNVLLYHKLAIACLDTGDRQAAQNWLRMADALIEAGKGTPMEEKMLAIVRFRLAEDFLWSDAYYRLLREVYDGIHAVYHHGFKQFHGNLLIEACVHNRRYKEALQIASEVDIFPEFIR